MTELSSPKTPTWILTLAVAIIGSNSFVLSPILAQVAADMDTQPVAVARAISAFGAATAVSSLVYARRGGGGSVRRVLTLCALIMTASLVGSAFSRAWYQLAFCQAVIGATVGQMLPTIYAAATANAPEGQGGAILGKILRGWGIALVLGVPFSAFVSDLAGWRAVYLVIAAAAAIATVGFAKLLPKETLDAAGGAGPGLSGAFAASGARPLLLICLLYMTAFYGLYPYIGLRLHETFGASASEAGIVVLVYGAGFGSASYAMGIIDRAGPRRVFAPILMAIAAIYLVLIPATATMPGALAGAFAWGIVNHIGVNLIILLLSRRGEASRSALMGLHTTTTYVAIFLGPAVLGALYTASGFASAGMTAAVFVALAAAVAWGKRTLW